MKMKIAFVYDAAYPWVKGGVERRIFELGRRLSLKHEVHLFSLKWWEDDEKIDGIFLHGVGEKIPLYSKGKRSLNEALYFGFKLLLGFKGDFDIIDSQVFPYLSCFSSEIHSILKKSLLLLTWHEVWDRYWFEYLGVMGLTGWVIERLVSKLPGKHIAVSQVTRRNLKKMGVNAYLVPNGIDFERIQQVKASSESSDIIFAGRLIKEKNVDVLIESVKLIKKKNMEVKCIIIGDGPERKRLEELVEKLELKRNIFFKGFLKDHDEVVSYMKASKVFVLPSTREGFGIAALEANACGLPVITVKHDMNAACDLIEGGVNGFICKLSPREISEAIMKAINNNMGEGCLKIAVNYDWNRIVKLYEGLLIEKI
ncbi:MAG: glycosyltransferase family 4 protein [Nitrososphaerota archaeon]|nr:glycosyltransferase family 4 protein [Nitrososphaerota archaeon]